MSARGIAIHGNEMSGEWRAKLEIKSECPALHFILVARHFPNITIANKFFGWNSRGFLTIKQTRHLPYWQLPAHIEWGHHEHHDMLGRVHPRPITNILVPKERFPSEPYVLPTIWIYIESLLIYSKTHLNSNATIPLTTVLSLKGVSNKN